MAVSPSRRFERRIDRYLLLEKLGRGSFGVVYRAHDPDLGREVAIKAVRGETIDAEGLERFRREALLIGRLDHKNIVRVHRTGESQGQPYIVFDLVEGETLKAQLLRAGPPRPRRAATIVLQLARAVAHAHAQGVLHRDLKPSNVLLDAQGVPHIADFGLGRFLERARTLTGTDQVVGTPAYMAPEQAAADHERVGPRTDVYGLGAILFHLLTGRPPYEGATWHDICDAVIDEPLPRLRSPHGRISAALEQVCLRCLEKDPAARYPDMPSVAAALEEGRERAAPGPAGACCAARPARGRRAHRAVARAGAGPWGRG